MSYLYGKGNSTPVPKGRLSYCTSCTHYIPNSELKYPCKKSHSQVGRAAVISFARDFKDCKLFEEQFVNAEGDVCVSDFDMLSWIKMKYYVPSIKMKLVSTIGIAGQ